MHLILYTSTSLMHWCGFNNAYYYGKLNVPVHVRGAHRTNFDMFYENFLMIIQMNPTSMLKHILQSIFQLYLFGFFSPTREFFTHLMTSPLMVKGCKFRLMLGTHGHWAVRVLWLSSEGSLMCHTYCDTGQPFLMVISKDPWNSYLLPSI